MSALQHIRDYLAEKFAGHDIDTLMTHFEAAIESKVEDEVAGLRQEIAELRNDLVGGRAPEPEAAAAADANPEPVLDASTDAQQTIEALPPIAQPDAKVEAELETDGSAA